MQRLGLAAAAGLIVTLGLFYFMSVLISGGKDLNKNSGEDNAIEFLRIKPQSDLETRKERLPKKPPEPEKPPEIKQLKVAQDNAPQKPQMNMNMPKLDAPLGKGDGPFLGSAGAGGGDSGEMPLVRIEPQYPRKAAMRGTEGWVDLTFDVTEAGTVSNVRGVSTPLPTYFLNPMPDVLF